VVIKFSTPGKDRAKNAAKNKFLSLCSTHAHPDARIVIEMPGTPTFQAELLGWDDYTMVIRRDNGRLTLIWQQPGMKISPADNKMYPPTKESNDGQRSDG
jgi:hypothetical protein